MIERRRVRRREASGGFQKSAKKNTEPSAACARARIDAPRRPAKGDLHQAPAIYASHGCHSRAPPSPPSHLRRAQELAAGPAPAHMAAPAPHAVRAAAGGARRGARRLGVSHVVPRRVRACLACGARRGGAVVARRPSKLPGQKLAKCLLAGFVWYQGVVERNGRLLFWECLKRLERPFCLLIAFVVILTSIRLATTIPERL